MIIKNGETGFYYLQSRYYDPYTARFINFDVVISGVGGDILGYNAFAYCHNNPTNNSDNNGNWPKWAKKIIKWVKNKINRPKKKRSNVLKPKSVASKSSSNSNRRPNTGDPGSTYVAPNGDTRTYGPDGNPKHDYDHSDHGRPDKHPHDSNGGHNHDWENGVRGPAYSMSNETAIGVALVAACTIGIIFVAVDDVTGVGIADDFLFAPLGAGISEGLIMIFG